MNLDLSTLLTILHFAGRESLKRMLTIPEAKIRDACRRAGTDPIAAINQRDQFAEQAVQLVEAIAVKGWVDPDHGGAITIS